MDPGELTNYLLKHGLIDTAPAQMRALSGGVSSEIWFVQTPKQAFVVKKALRKLRVAADWYADLTRNVSEQEYINYARQWLPEAFPGILHSDPDAGLFIMEYLGEAFINWKQKLLAGEVEPADTRSAAEILGVIHRRSWGDTMARERFDTGQNFHELRLEPYLLTTAEKHPGLRPQFVAEAERLARTRQCLVHGDYSPKNILIGADRVVVLDCEVAWFGDPAFDVAFCLNHFLLKALHAAPGHQPFIRQVHVFRDQYRQLLGTYYEKQQLEARIAHLLPMLLLARIDGKSPVEYITRNEPKQLVRDFTTRVLQRGTTDLDDLSEQWQHTLSQFSNHA